MIKSATNIIIIDDEPELSEHELIFELKILYNELRIFPNPDLAIEFFKEKKASKNIIILDYRFENFSNGSEILKKIREINKITPVILWTANSDKISEFVEIINNNIFAVMPKSPYEPVLEKIKKAEEKQETSIEGALEDWIAIQNKEKLDEPYFIQANGKKYSLNDLLNEIRLQTKFGLQVQKDLMMLTIDLLIRNKEQLP